MRPPLFDGFTATVCFDSSDLVRRYRHRSAVGQAVHELIDHDLADHELYVLQ